MEVSWLNIGSSWRNMAQWKSKTIAIRQQNKSVLTKRTISMERWHRGSEEGQDDEDQHPGAPGAERLIRGSCWVPTPTRWVGPQMLIVRTCWGTARSASGSSSRLSILRHLTHPSSVWTTSQECAKLSLMRLSLSLCMLAQIPSDTTKVASWPAAVIRKKILTAMMWH